MRTSGQIPAYGEHFTRVSVGPDFERGLDATEYQSKRVATWSVRASRGGWFIFFRDEAVAGGFPRMTDAANRLIMALWELYGTEDEPMPKGITGKRNRP